MSYLQEQVVVIDTLFPIRLLRQVSASLTSAPKQISLQGEAPVN